MGVIGWNRLLGEHGYLPDPNSTTCCSVSLWNEESTVNHSQQQQEASTATTATTVTPTNVDFYFHHNGSTQATEASAATSSTSKYVAIPHGSEFHVDGYGLCYHIIGTAYARHINSVLHSKSNHQERPCARTPVASLTVVQARQLNPNFSIPNKIIHEVTKEFINTLQLCQITMTIYWDGSQRYVHKHSTDTKRNKDRNTTYFNLQQYCNHGTLPPMETNYYNKTSSLLCNYLFNNFPSSKLYMTQIHHALHVTGKIAKVECVNEADEVLAKAVSGKHNAFVLAFDSDFCFYKDVQYIPIPTMQIHNPAKSTHNTKSFMKACVVTRDVLASELHLPDSDIMIEVAILFGNDFIVPTNSSNPHHWSNSRIQQELFSSNRRVTRSQKENKLSYDVILSFLQNQRRGFLLTSSNVEIQRTIQFVRRMYNLQQPVTSSDLSTVIYDQEDLIHELLQEENSVRPHVSKDEINAMDITIPPISQRTSIKEIVLRSLRNYISYTQDQDENDHKRHKQGVAINVTDDHMTAFDELKLNERQSYSIVDQSLGAINPNWRPSYSDVCVVYLIEKILIDLVEKNYTTSIMIKLNAPHVMFDPYKYHVQLLLVREAKKRAMSDAFSSLSLTSSTTRTTPKSIVSKQGGGRRKSKSHHSKTSDAYGTDNTASKNSSNDVPDGGTHMNQEQEEVRPILPVDEFESEIVQSVYKNRVTIIQGETGCGKSSRIPIMLLEAPPPPDSSHNKSKMFISQPRRIAAKALVERLRTVEPAYRDAIALRMGHGVREYETGSTRAYFVTTGYLVRLLANNPKVFDKVTYLIIDEVHERSVDTDILCLLCRRLLLSNKHIRLVLMSATLAAALYQDYFDVSQPVIKVGARRFPVEEVYLSDISKTIQLGSKAKNVKILTDECLKMKCNQTPSLQYMDHLFTVAAYLATTVGKPGTSVLIFVTGMNDIVAIMDIVESTIVPGITFTCIPIHGDIPFEDQMTAFDVAKPNEVKIIIATNAAESSVTLPDVDNVICLGLCKQIEYNPTSHRQMLSPTWISRASATQRAGRTGRLRPGTVYRLYERELFATHMEEFEQGEMVRVPLDNVILTLKQMITDESVTDVLASCLEPPNLTTIDRSFLSLFSSNFITSPLDDDACHITQLGHFVSALGIDLALGSLVGLGIQFGVGAEAIQLAGILSFPKSPWIQSNPLFFDAEEFNSMSATTFVSRCYFDANLFSEPFALMNMLWEYKEVTNEFSWTKKHGIHNSRLKRLHGTCINLKKRVSDFLKIPIDLVEITSPPRFMPHAIVTILRIIQVWVFNETLLQFDPKSLQQEKSQSDVVLSLWQKSDAIKKRNLDQIFKDPKRHPFTLVGQSCVETKASFSISESGQQGHFDILDNFQERLISYATEKEVGVVVVSFKDTCVLYYHQDITTVADLPDINHNTNDIITLSAKVSSRKSRGRGERPCGIRNVTHHDDNSNSSADEDAQLWTRITLTGNYKRTLTSCIAYFEANVSTKLFLSFSVEAVVDHAKIKVLKFSLTVEGIPKGISDQDLKDLFASTSIQSTKTVKPITQKLVFPFIQNNMVSDSTSDDTSSLSRPLIQCIPEGARLLSVLASSRRGKESIIHLSPLKESKDDQNNGDTDNLNGESKETLVLYVEQMSIMQRWKRFGASRGQVYVDANSVPGSAVPMYGTDMMYCTCSDTLEVRGGGLRANGGLTLLPPGKLFVQLCRFTFGIYKQENIDDGTYVEKTIDMVGPDCSKAEKKRIKKRVVAAVEFNESSMSLGEQLQCFPEKVQMILKIFDGVDGYSGASTVWEELQNNPFLRQNLEKSRREMQDHHASIELEQRTARLMME